MFLWQNSASNISSPKLRRFVVADFDRIHLMESMLQSANLPFQLATCQPTSQVTTMALSTSENKAKKTKKQNKTTQKNTKKQTKTEQTNQNKQRK